MQPREAGSLDLPLIVGVRVWWGHSAPVVYGWDRYCLGVFCLVIRPPSLGLWQRVQSLVWNFVLFFYACWCSQVASFSSIQSGCVEAEKNPRGPPLPCHCVFLGLWGPWLVGLFSPPFRVFLCLFVYKVQGFSFYLVGRLEESISILSSRKRSFLG